MNDFLDPIVRGLRLLWAQSAWTVIAWLRQREIAGLRRRVHDEYLRVGQVAYDAWKNGTPIQAHEGEIALALRQVDFLLDEIRHLEEALSQERQRFFQEKGLTPPQEN